MLSFFHFSVVKVSIIKKKKVFSRSFVCCQSGLACADSKNTALQRGGGIAAGSSPDLWVPAYAALNASHALASLHQCRRASNLCSRCCRSSAAAAQLGCAADVV